MYFCCKVVFTLFNNKQNHEGWPVVVSRDVSRHVATLKRQMYAVIGQVVGKTYLALPTTSEQIDDAIHQYEE